MQTLFTLFSVAIFVCASVFAADWKKHPHLHKANEAIEHAQHQLKEAKAYKTTAHQTPCAATSANGVPDAPPEFRPRLPQSFAPLRGSCYQPRT